MSESFETPQPSDNESKNEHNAVGCGPESIDFSEDDWKSFLETCSKLDMFSVYTVTRADGGVAYKGTIPNLFRLAGVEEFHHSVYEQYKGKQQGGDPLKESIPEYDAQDNEFRALRWQARHALDGMDDITIKNLERRITDAREVRKKG